MANDMRLKYRCRSTGWRSMWIVAYIIFHIGAISAIWHTTALSVMVAAIMFFASGCLGITLGYHRLLTHRSFKTYPVVKYALAVCGCMAFLGGPIEYVGMHRRHHQYADTEHDPHTPRCSLWWAHYEYFFAKHRYDWSKCAKDLERDRWLKAIDKSAVFIGVITIAALYLIGQATCGEGVSWMLWAGPLRIVAVSHVGGAINSWTHSRGYRNFDTPDESRNSRILGILAFGEGYHNNHHAQPRSAAHGMYPGEYDATYAIIRAMKRLGLAWSVVAPRLNKRK